MIFSPDTEEPSLNCRDVTSGTDFGLISSSSVTIGPNATDNVDDMVSVNCSHTSADTFPIGKTNVTCEATDAAGNIGNCNFVVIVTGMGQLGISKSNAVCEKKITIMLCDIIAAISHLSHRSNLRITDISVEKMLLWFHLYVR